MQKNVLSVHKAVKIKEDLQPQCLKELSSYLDGAHAKSLINNSAAVVVDDAVAMRHESE